jgi:hypothetical protein
MFPEAVTGKFPRFPAAFPASGAKSPDFGHNCENSGLRSKKFAAKFPAAGNLYRWTPGQKGTFRLCVRGPGNGFEDHTKPKMR